MAEPTGQFSIAFDDGSLVWAPAWTSLAQDYPNLVTSYTIDRGRQYELDHTDVGRATVTIADIDGVLDPTNADGPFFGRIHPFHQAAIARWNPVTDDWWTRFRGFVENYSYDFDSSQQVNRLTVTLIDLQGLLSTIEMVPGLFGIDTTGTSAAGQIGFPIQNMDQRIEAVLGDAGIPDEFAIVFSGNVELHANVYSPAETVMTVIQDAADAEFPGVANAYVDRLGRLAVHGRLAKFDPVTTWENNFYPAWSSSTAYVTGDKVMSASVAYLCVLAHTNHIPPNATYWDQINLKWDFGQWTVGDGAAVHAAPSDTAQVRAFAYETGVSKLINSALTTPIGIQDTDVVTGTPISLGGDVYSDGQHVFDTGSIASYGYRSWSAQNLITKRGLVDSSTDLVETQRFGQYYVTNYSEARNRITTITFRSMSPTDPRAAHNWELLSKVDIADIVTVTVQSPGGGGFSAEEFYVEGIHEQVNPLNSNYDDVTLSLDLSPKAYYTTNPFPGP